MPSKPSVRRGILLTLAVVVLALACSDGDPPAKPNAEETISVSGGQINGTPLGDDTAIRVYKGIPFAEPPVGALRWRSPQPVVVWDGVLETNDFSPACMQRRRSADSFYGPGADQMSEDCLYLNVWSGAWSPDERRPVMVWIHGGGLRNGNGGNPTYDGEALARRGVVLVTINYRLGPWGFLAHPLLSAEDEHGSSGNYGVLDQIAALEWVRDNIASFGGDPDRVLVFGESAGSLSVSYLVASPLAAGLFHRAIAESGSAVRSTPYLKHSSSEGEAAEVAGQRFLEALLDAGDVTLEAMRATTSEAVLETFSSEGVNFPSRANVDGWMLPDTVYNLYADGRQNDVPVLLGSNADEGPALLGSRGPRDVESYRALALEQYRALSEEFLALYPASSDEGAWPAYADSYGDQVFGWGMRTWARQTANVDSPAYLYFFRRVPPNEGGERFGSYHAAEIAYVFDNLSKSVRNYDDEDRELADLMASYWVNFAASGDPNGDGLPEWPTYSDSEGADSEGADSEATMIFDAPAELGHSVRQHKLDFFDRYFERQRQQSTGGG